MTSESAMPHDGSQSGKTPERQVTSAEIEPLFREEAMPASGGAWLGEVVFARPLSFAVFTTFGLIVLIAVLLLGYFGSYSKKSTVIGQVLPESGVIKLYPPFTGYIFETKAAEGKHVRKGELLFLITSDKNTIQGEAQAAVSSNMKATEGLLNDEILRTRQLHTQSHEALVQKINNYKAEVNEINGMIATQRQRVAVSQDIEARYRGLLSSQYVSEAEVQAKKAELLDQQTRLTSLLQNKTATERELLTAEADLRDLPFKVENSVADLQREYHTTDSQFLESEVKRQIAITAPVDGTLSSVNAQFGQAVEQSRSLVSILPDGTILQAVLYASSKDIGFVKQGDRVKVRYEAYPYMRYGTYDGQVIAISRSALAPSELAAIGDLLLQRALPADRGTPLYRVIVRLDRQTVMADGKLEPLHSNMIVEADLIQDTRRLYEWVVEPLYALGK